MRRLFRFSIAVVALVLGLTGCAEEAAPEFGEDAVILDVRTPEEYAAGHLEGAVLLDFNGGQFAAELPNLDPDAEYVVYCRSGNRAGQAVALMEKAGIGAATNAGSLEQAAKATGLAVVE
ncbi:MAG TPA: rhodanese-like domain-containing protein [Arachnia sp.]|jgi:rhodanese-related sulfurtransferase|nr:rhodanese-like domain-containing protein [Propionibacteriaceae bacterium]HOA27664.1 rhodanese-like domain-containing protein [Arachnia sp.]HQD21270.1 rhodanese-like domain-containing protein [Arachnia sp.]